MAKTYQSEPATTAKDQDRPEIMLMFAVIGLMAVGIAGWVLGGLPLAIGGAAVGALLFGYLGKLMLRRVNHVTKDMQLERE